jgi:hypothetical protein
LSATYQDGYRCIAQVSVFGADAVKKARRTGEALLQRVRALMSAKGYTDFEKTAVDVLGAEDGYGPHAQAFALREAIVRIAVTHRDRNALEIFSRESRAPGVSFAPGTTAGSGLTLNSRPAVEPRYRLFSCLVPKPQAPTVAVVLDGTPTDVPLAALGEAIAPSPGATPVEPDSGGVASGTVPLIALAHGRSGDKGDTNNVAIIARDPKDLPLLRRELTAERVRAYLGHLVRGDVIRYEVPGLHALNFLLLDALDGGGPTSLRPDPMGKGMAQMVLGMTIAVR